MRVEGTTCLWQRGDVLTPTNSNKIIHTMLVGKDKNMQGAVWVHCPFKRLRLSGTKQNEIEEAQISIHYNK